MRQQAVLLQKGAHSAQKVTADGPLGAIMYEAALVPVGAFPWRTGGERERERGIRGEGEKEDGDEKGGDGGREGGC